MPSKTRKLEQTTKLIRTLVKNKALLYKCLIKGTDEEDQCRRILMEKILAVIEDERFQTWPQIKAWALKNYHRQLRKGRGYQTQKSGCSPRVSFEDLVLVVRTSEIATNVHKLLNSVIDAVGTRELTGICQHVLTGGGLPEDLKSLIFTQEFFGIWETHVKKATSNPDAENINTTEDGPAGRREHEERVISIRRPNADQVQSPAAEGAHMAEKEPEHPPGPAPIVRSFADFNVVLQAASATPDPDPRAEVLSGRATLELRVALNRTATPMLP
ncbi:hypothetical protein O1611_g9688 [Lasiodiplodia mahajangana]|uniref:Uncharacterized protein n=1 Tax=Lasiodiplodia mahajangana TaxID=1108764 RepID=A0ACC2J6E9_9PEZI|nr:hypothetical protein O1611_g9688 [Lasiodiplodia mahajangana]